MTVENSRESESEPLATWAIRLVLRVVLIHFVSVGIDGRCQILQLIIGHCHPSLHVNWYAAALQDKRNAVAKVDRCRVRERRSVVGADEPFVFTRLGEPLQRRLKVCEKARLRPLPTPREHDGVTAGFDKPQKPRLLILPDTRGRLGVIKAVTADDLSTSSFINGKRNRKLKSVVHERDLRMSRIG